MTSEMPLYYRSQSLASTQTRLLGVCWIAYGVLRLAMTVWLMTFTTTATLMFGALLTRVPDPFTLMSVFHFLYLGITMWSAVAGVLGMVAGVMLLSGLRSARVLTIVAALMALSELPVGIALGIYTLIVLLRPMAAPPAATAAPASR
jgi:hypothetical protein